jgi:hypothetical protein
MPLIPGTQKIHFGLMDLLVSDFNCCFAEYQAMVRFIDEGFL